VRLIDAAIATAFQTVTLKQLITYDLAQSSNAALLAAALCLIAKAAWIGSNPSILWRSCWLRWDFFVQPLALTYAISRVV